LFKIKPTISIRFGKQNMPQIRQNPARNLVIPRCDLLIPRTGIDLIVTPIKKPLSQSNILIARMLPYPLARYNKLRTALRPNSIRPSEMKMQLHIPMHRLILIQIATKNGRKRFGQGNIRRRPCTPRRYRGLQPHF
jgi:hypothetical protein